MTIFIFCVLMLSSCGYRPMLADLPDTVISVPSVANRTSLSGIAVPLTIGVRQKLKSSGIRVSDRPRLDAAQLDIEIMSVCDGTGVLGVHQGDLVARDVIWKMDLIVELVSADGRKLFGPKRVTVDGRNLTAGGLTAEQYAGENTRVRLVAKAADLILSIVLEAL